METIRANEYHDLVSVTDPQVSPDGERVAFVRSVPKDDEKYEATVYVVPLGGDEPKQFTISEGVDSSPRWSPSGDRLAFVSTRGADDDRPQLWVMPTAGGEARQVTDVAGGVSQLAWSPDGTKIAFVQSSTEDDRDEERDISLDGEEYEPETPDPRVIDRKIYRAGTSYFDGKRSHVYLVDLDDDSVERLTDGDFDFAAPDWGDETTLYFGAEREDDPDDNITIDVVAYDIDADEEETLFQTSAWGASLAATEDGRIAYIYSPEENATLRQADLKVFDRGTGETVTLTETLDRTVAIAPEWDPEEERVYFGTPDEGDQVIWRARGDGSEELQRVVGDGHITDFSVGADAVAYAKSEWDHPGDLFVSTPGGAETHRLTRANAEYLNDRAVGQPEELRFESDEGVEIQGWLLTPPDFDADEQYPLVVEIHGGPHAMWSTSGTMWHEFQTLAAEGYVVFWSNPRGSTGYGEEHMAAIGRDWGDTTMTDVMAGVDLVAERDYIDEDDMFVTGGSFGGYMTAWIVGHTDRFKGAVSQRGVYELSSFYGSTDAFKLIEWDFDTTPWEEPEFLWERSPTAYVEDVTTPTLLIHSDNDFRVPVNNAEMLYLLLKKNDVETRLVRYPREGHELSRSGEPGHVVDRLERIVRWFDGYSDHRDVPKALDRGDDGLSANEDDEDDETEE
ncbi:S9 family peptidase [Haladaptatus sp. T7]|uniref:S9 family peptidase n=1 Tax=Haladaptatus sp. T7 TaxID=2029368 RepID=UPI0021A2536A|nr:S9 family peptidase [Haladaptatus sp. T7]GKZ14871.1 acylaminoacyl-peptidase [Haladaptatus sp. T7]